MNKPILGYIQYYEDFDVEGLFDANFKLVSWWSCSDASWRDEYFAHGFDKLGVRIRRMPWRMMASGKKQLKQEIKKTWGEDVE